MEKDRPMFALAKTAQVSGRRRVAVARYTTAGAFVRKTDLTEALEDERLNAIADERAGGPFVRVSLDDL